MADVIVLCVLVVIWFVYFWIYRRGPSRENLVLFICASVLVAGHVLVILAVSWPGFGSEQRKAIYSTAAYVSILGGVILLGAKMVFSYLRRRGNDKR